MKLIALKKIVLDIENTYKSLVSGKGDLSSTRYSLLYYVHLLPILLVWGVERIKDPSIAMAYFGALTAILGVIVTGKVKQYGKEIIEKKEDQNV